MTFFILWHTTHQVSWSCHLWLSLVFVPPLLLRLCCIFRWFRLHALGNAIPPLRSSVSWCLMSVKRALVAVTGAHCYFGSSMCLSKRGSGFPLLQRDSTRFGVQRSHDGWRPQQPPCEPPPPNCPLHTFPFVFIRAKTNKRGCAVLVAAVQWSDFSYLDEANLSWSRCPG